MNWIATLSPAIARDELATTSSWWWIIELSLVGLLLLSSAFVAGLIVRSGRDESTDDGVLLKRPVLWISIAFALMAVTGLLFMPETKSSDRAWLSWFVVAASVLFVIAGGMFSAKLMQTVFSRQIRDRIFHGFCISVTSFSVLTLVIMMSAIGYLGWKYLSWDLVTSFASRDAEKAGVKAALWGTIWICLLCALFAIPIGTATALYLEEYSKKGRLHRIIDLNISNLAGVPSIVYGIIGLTIFARMFGLFGGINEPSVQIGTALRLVPVGFGRSHQCASGGPERGARRIDRWIAGIGFQHESGDHQDRSRWNRIGRIRSSLGIRCQGANPEIRGQKLVLPSASLWRNRSGRRADTRARGPSNRHRRFQGGHPIGSSIASRSGHGMWSDTLADGSKGDSSIGDTGDHDRIHIGSQPSHGGSAPLLVLTGILFIRFTPEHLMDDFTAMPLQIYNWAQRPQEEFHAVAASGIVVLLFLLLGFNAIAVLIRQYFQKPQQ